MKRFLPIAATAALAVLVSSTAAAQPYGPPPPPPGGSGYGPGPGYGPPPGPPPRRIGFGGGLGIGFMNNKYDDLECFDCDFEPIAGDFQLYGGLFLTPQILIGLEGDVTLQTLDAQGSNYLMQSTAIIFAKLFLNEALWVKGGLGWSGLSIYYDDFYGPVEQELANGGAVMLGIGWDFYQAPQFTMDANFKFIGSGYDSLDDEIYSGTFNLGFNFYL